MSLSRQVTCECGFESNLATFGMQYGDPQVYFVPVFLSLTGELVGYPFREVETGLKDMALVEWVEKHGDEQIRERLGDNVAIFGSWPEDGPIPPIRCPICGNETARFVSGGF